MQPIHWIICTILICITMLYSANIIKKAIVFHAGILLGTLIMDPDTFKKKMSDTLKKTTV